jgi:hypothetical protein
LNFTAAPAVTFASLATVTNTTPAFALSGGAPSGGTYTGTGVSNGNFDPVLLVLLHLVLMLLLIRMVALVQILVLLL